MIYTKICIEIATGVIVNSYRGTEEITNKFPELYEWISWGKELPEDVLSEDISYIIVDGEVVQKEEIDVR